MRKNQTSDKIRVRFRGRPRETERERWETDVSEWLSELTSGRRRSLRDLKHSSNTQTRWFLQLPWNSLCSIGEMVDYCHLGTLWLFIRTPGDWKMTKTGQEKWLQGMPWHLQPFLFGKQPLQQPLVLFGSWALPELQGTQQTNLYNAGKPRGH